MSGNGISAIRLSSITTGFQSGLVATLIAGSMLLMNNALRGIPEIQIARTLAGILGSPDQIMVGVAGILVTGIFVFGALYAVLSPRLPLRSQLGRSLAFAAASWLLMMLVFMPVGGSGWFGLNGGPIVPLATLVLSIVYWIVLGVTYRWLATPDEESDGARA